MRVALEAQIQSIRPAAPVQALLPRQGSNSRRFSLDSDPSVDGTLERMAALRRDLNGILGELTVASHRVVVESASRVLGHSNLPDFRFRVQEQAELVRKIADELSGQFFARGDEASGTLGRRLYTWARRAEIFSNGGVIA